MIKLPKAIEDVDKNIDSARLSIDEHNRNIKIYSKIKRYIDLFLSSFIIVLLIDFHLSGDVFYLVQFGIVVAFLSIFISDRINSLVKFSRECIERRLGDISFNIKCYKIIAKK